MNKIIKQIFGLDRLYDRKFGFAFVVDMLYVVFVALTIDILTFGVTDTNDLLIIRIVIIAILGAATLYLLQEIIQTLVVRQYIRNRKYLVMTSEMVSFGSSIGTSSISDEFAVQSHINYMYIDKEKIIYDLRKDFYRKTKYGEYKSKEAYYTVFEYKLKRKLPNVVFDSRRAKGRQFSKHYVGAQRVRLEGNFSDEFNVYMPKYYQIDTLSFVTPEIMQAMLTATDCDFEIYEDRLLCYAPLLDAQEVENVKNKTTAVYAALNDNLESYRDERLEFATGKKQVTTFGSKLLRSPKKYVAPMIIGGIGSVAFIVGGYLYDTTVLYNEVAILVYAIFVINLYNIIKLMIANAKIEKQFTQKYKND